MSVMTTGSLLGTYRCMIRQADKLERRLHYRGAQQMRRGALDAVFSSLRSSHGRSAVLRHHERILMVLMRARQVA